jgi:hypothetical protein
LHIVSTSFLLSSIQKKGAKKKSPPPTPLRPAPYLLVGYSKDSQPPRRRAYAHHGAFPFTPRGGGAHSMIREFFHQGKNEHREKKTKIKMI